jgi:hypothetical protein
MMPYELLFQLANLWIMPFWLLMILVPHWRWTGRILSSVWSIAPLALGYVVLVLPQVVNLLPVLANPTSAALASLLGAPEAAVIAWLHFLAFDLFVGRWIYLDSRSRRISAWLVSPTLFFTLMLGPLGLLIYLIVRRLVGQTANANDTTQANSTPVYR